VSTSPSTSDDILASARTLIVAGGYNAFSYADIASVVGIRKASIHYYFPTKADLVRTLVAQYRAEAAAGLAAVEAHVADPVAQLRGYVDYWQTCIADGTAPFCICALLACELPTLPEPVAAEVGAHFRTLSAWITAVLARGAEAGDLRVTDDAATEAEALVATVHGAMLSARALANPEMFTTITNSMLARLTADA
jgi:TetR/AcrR family transcriptional regulator, transcriptional repressor for nem operon